MVKSYKWLYVTLSVIVVLCLVIGVGIGAYFLGLKSTTKNGLANIPSPIPKTNTTITLPTQAPVEGSLFSGKVQKISKDLQLFTLSDSDKLNNVSENIIYYEAGVFTRGELKGYTRVLASRPAEGPGPSLQFLLATKDFTDYILDDPNNKTVNYPAKDWDNPYAYLDKSKIIKTAIFETEHPKSIKIDSLFGLIRKDTVLIKPVNTHRKGSGGYEIYEDVPTTQFDQYQSLSSPDKRLQFHADFIDSKNKYVFSSTYVHASDSTGLAYTYVLSTQKEIDSYLGKLPTYEQELVTYKKLVATIDGNSSMAYPTYPEAPPFPGMRLAKATDGLPENFYNSYDVAFPGACGGSMSTSIVSSIQDDELVPLSSSTAYPLFILKDAKHPLNEMEYQSKVSVNEDYYKDVNDGKSPPTIDEYTVKHPLIFFKDAWGRWGVMGEYDIKLMGGCGKPVVYLYPEKPTNVRLSFATPISLNTQIPAYHEGWFVRAEPNGVLTDLQPQYTDCSKIDTTRFGSEYASKACKANTYPYIYWSGKSMQNPYPIADGGWVVAKAELDTFMNGKLKEIGLSDKEVHDMTLYWVPKMEQKDAPYYRISFFLTKDMNAFIPMNVYPQPDSILRVFLDYQPLEAKPTKNPAPQQFEKFVRHGFSLVEWGGLR